MVKDKFYRDMTNYQLKAVFKQILENIKADPTSEGMKKELEVCKNVMVERGIEFEDSISTSLDVIRGFMEFEIDKPEVENEELKVQHGGAREGAGATTFACSFSSSSFCLRYAESSIILSLYSSISVLIFTRSELPASRFSISLATKPS